MCHPFFDELRDPNTRLPDSRHHNNPSKDLPELFNFSRHGKVPDSGLLLDLVRDRYRLTVPLIELSIAPALNSQLVPAHARPALEAHGLDIDNFKPMTKEEMAAHLD